MKIRRAFLFSRSAQTSPGEGGSLSPVLCGQRTRGSLCQALSLFSLGSPLAEGLGLPGPHRLPRMPGLCGPQSPVLPLLFPALAPSPTSLLCLRVWGNWKGEAGEGGGLAEPDVHTPAFHQRPKLEKEKGWRASQGAGAADWPVLSHPAGFRGLI